jgi:Protein of unknown function (DUF2846)
MFSCAAILAFGSSCTQTNVPTAAEVELAASANPTKGKALIYVYNSSSSGIRIVQKHILIDGRSIGILKGSSYIVSSLDPGKRTIYAGGDPITVNARSGQIYYLSQNHSLQSGSMISLNVPAPLILTQPRDSFATQLVSREVAMRELEKCTLLGKGDY